MGVYVEIQAVVKPADNSRKISIDLTGLNFSKWEHPLTGLFGGIVEKYIHLEEFFKSTISEDDLNYMKMQDSEEGECSFTNWLESSKFYSIISTVESTKLLEISSNFETDDENGKIQFLTSFAKLQTLAEREKNQNSKIEITFIYS